MKNEKQRCSVKEYAGNMEGLEHIKANVEAVRGRIAEACEKAGRRSEDVSLLAVTKMRAPDEINAVIRAGVNLIGENRVQEAQAKRAEIRGEFEFHLVGHLQTNKAAAAADMFDVIQSVDSYRLAEKLSAEAVKINKVLRIYIQVNSSSEETKTGLEPVEAPKEAERIRGLPGIELCGLMTIGPLTDDENEVRRAFTETRGLFEKMRAADPDMKVLSMGMTDDLEIAIQEGATLVRVGRALFGRRC